MKTHPIVSSHSLRVRSAGRFAVCSLAPVVAALAFLCVPARGQDTFTGGAGITGLAGGDVGAYDFSAAGNWTGGAPTQSSGGYTLINSPGDIVDYFGGTYGDPTVSGGGTLEVAGGEFHEVTGNNWFQLNGGSTILVDGGNLNLSNDTAGGGFNLGGSGNLLNVTAGSVEFPMNLQVNTGFTFELSGGTVTINGNELDYNTASSTIISGGVLNVNLITGINSGGVGQLTLSGGIINLGPGGIYAESSTEPVNFTTGSTGEVTFPATDFSTSTLQGWVNNGGFSYNDTTDPSQFQVVSDGSLNVVELVPASVPEPQTWAMLIGGVGALCSFQRIRRRNR